MINIFFIPNVEKQCIQIFKQFLDIKIFKLVYNFAAVYLHLMANLSPIRSRGYNVKEMLSNL